MQVPQQLLPLHLQVPWLLTQNLDPPAPHCLPIALVSTVVHLGPECIWVGYSHGRGKIPRHPQCPVQALTLSHGGRAAS